MSQINVTPPPGDRSGGAGINFLAVVIGLILLLIVAWFLFFGGPFRGAGNDGDTNINVNPPAQSVPGTDGGEGGEGGETSPAPSP